MLSLAISSIRRMQTESFNAPSVNISNTTIVICCVSMGYFASFYIPDIPYYFRMFCITHLTSTVANKNSSFDVNANPKPITFEARVFPCDIDRNGHMNNARYIRELNFARRHFFVSLGLWAYGQSNNINFIVGSQTIRYRRELHVFQYYTIEHRILAWSNSEKCFYIEAKFIRNKFVMAVQVVKYMIVGSTHLDKLRLQPTEIMKACGILPNDFECKDQISPFVDAWEISNRISSLELNPSKKNS